MKKVESLPLGDTADWPAVCCQAAAGDRRGLMGLCFHRDGDDTALLIDEIRVRMTVTKFLGVCLFTTYISFLYTPLAPRRTRASGFFLQSEIHT